MIRSISLAATALLFALPLFVSAQAAPDGPPAFLKDLKSPADFGKLTPEQQDELKRYMGRPSTAPEAPKTPEGTVDCFQYYRFGSVQVDVSPSVASTVPGIPVTFSGKIKNANPYPVIGGSVYAKVFRKQSDDALAHQNGHFLVDQFVVKDGITLRASGEESIVFDWTVPRTAPSGEYEIAMFFYTAERFNLLGLTFTDDVVGNKTSFAVKSDMQGEVALDKNAVTLNGAPYRFAAFPPRFGKDESVRAEVVLRNTTKESQSVALSWTLSNWDALRESNRIDGKKELIALKPGETKTLSYETTKYKGAVSFLVVEADTKGQKSILDIRWVRTDVSETRINFPGILKFPIVKGEENTVFSCAHSTNLPLVENSEIEMTLKDASGKVIHEYAYRGGITGAMMGVKDNFVPKETSDKFTLTTTLKKDGKVVESLDLRYDCETIDPSLCSEKQASMTGKGTNGLGGSERTIALLVVLVLAALLGLLAWKLRKDRKGPKLFPVLFAMFLSAGLLFGGEAEAKSVSCSTGGCMSSIPSLQSLYNVYESYGSSLFSGGIATINYGAEIIDDATGLPIVEFSTIPIGTAFHIVPKPYENTDLSWFMSGWWDDSPHGYWTPQGQQDWPGEPLLADCSGGSYGFFCFAFEPVNSIVSGNPSDYDMKLITCSGSQYLVRSTDTCGSFSYFTKWYNLYTPGLFPDLQSGSENKAAAFQAYMFGGRDTLNDEDADVTPFTRFYVTEPIVSYSVTGPVSCVGNACTVVGAGPISASATFQSTTGRFKLPSDKMVGVAYGVGMYSLRKLDGSNYTLDVPAQTLTWNLTAAASGNTAPAAPNIVPSALNDNYTGSPQSFDFTSTDLENDPLRYGVDWDNDGSIDQWLPGAGTVASGTPQTGTYPGWPIGAHTFQVLAQDLGGLSSAWTPHTVTITDPPALPNILTLCQDSCGSGIRRDGFTIGMGIGETRTYFACHSTNADCTNPGGGASATWTDGGNPTISLSGPNPAPSIVIHGDASGTETVTATVSGAPATGTIIIPLTCASSCTAARRATECSGVSFPETNSCGAPETCTGTRYCDFNWKEVAPGQ